MKENPEARSQIMRSVKSENTAPEMLVRHLAHQMGYRFRLHRRDLPGKPDLVFPARRKVVFVHGCFWHGHDCMRGARLPVSNRIYWKNKIAQNRMRDQAVPSLLRSMGWRSLVVWECETKAKVTLERRLRRFLDSNAGNAARR
jgi:DNA mismatch endonuclease (patch repair protein)